MISNEAKLYMTMVLACCDVSWERAALPGVREVQRLNYYKVCREKLPVFSTGCCFTLSSHDSVMALCASSCLPLFLALAGMHVQEALPKLDFLLLLH